MKPILQTVAKLIIDTLAEQAVVVEKPVNNALEVLTQVNEFYNSAWDKLIFIILGAFTILGVFVPFVIQHFQNKSLKASEKELESKLNLKIADLKKALEENLDKKLEENIAEYINDFENKIEKIKESASGSAFHTQANTNNDKKWYKAATRDYVHASVSYTTAEDYINLKATLTGILDCMDNLKKEDINYLENVESINITETLDDIENKTTGGAFTRDIRAIKAKILKIMNTKEESIEEPKEE